LVLLIVALSAWVLGFAVTIRSHNNVITQAELAKAQGVEAKKKKVAVKRPRKRALHAGAGFLMPPTPEPAKSKTGTKPPDDPKKKKKAPEQNDDDADTEDPKQDTTEDDSDKEAKAGNLLSDIAQRAADMAEDDSLSNEVRARCSVVAGILNDVGTDIASAMEQISAAAESQDLAKLSELQQTLNSGCGKRLQRAAAELASMLQASDDLDETAAGAVQEMAESITAALSGIMPAGDTGGGQEQDPAEGGTGDWVNLEEESDDDKDDDSEDDEEKDEDEEDDDSEREDEDEKEEDEDEEKDEDDDADKEDDADDEKEDDDSEDDEDEKDDDADDEDNEDKDGEDDDEDKDDDEEDRDEKDEEEIGSENPGVSEKPNPGADGKDDDEDSEDKDDEDDEEKEASDDKDDDEDEPAKKPGKGGGKKPKAIDLNTMARKLAADAIRGEPFDLKAHNRFGALVLAGGSIDPSTLAMYRGACGDGLRKALKVRPKKK
jgi:hypothetical protein